MEHIIGKNLLKFEKQIYAVFRIIVGFMFFQHGAQKLFAWFGSQGAADSGTLFWYAGLIEVIVGLMLVFGLFTRLFAVVGIIEMAYAYFAIHAKNALWPIMNQGELAVLYFVAFAIIAAYGSKAWSLDKLLLEKEIF